MTTKRFLYTVTVGLTNSDAVFRVSVVARDARSAKRRAVPAHLRRAGFTALTIDRRQALGGQPVENPCLLCGVPGCRCWDTAPQTPSFVLEEVAS